MRRHLLLASLLALPAFACGGSPNVNPLDVNLSGSYELTAGTVVQKPVYQGGPQPVNAPSPSNGKRFRLDLRRSGGSYEAVVTPEWGNPTSMTVAVASGSLVLTGEANVAGGGNYGGVYDSWTSMTVPVGPDGLGANVSLTGSEMVSEGDVGWMYDVSVGASIVRDKEAPEFKVSSGGTAAGKYLPWDKLRVTASEPVNPERFRTSVHANVKSSNAVFVTRNDGANAAAVDWAGHVLLEGGFDNFDAPGGQGLLTIDPGIPDLAGNIGAPAMQPQSAAFEVVELGAPQVEIDFDGKDTFAPALWGNAEIIKGVECEANVGCARLGTFQQMYCASSSDGIAARLTGPGAKKLAFRYRVRLDAKYGGGGVSMYENNPVLNVELARAGAALTKATVPTPKLVSIGTQEQPSFESDWVDASVVLPAGGSTLGFAIRPTSMFPYGCGGGPAPVPMDVTVWVDSLRME